MIAWLSRSYNKIVLVCLSCWLSFHIAESSLLVTFFPSWLTIVVHISIYGVLVAIDLAIRLRQMSKWGRDAFGRDFLLGYALMFLGVLSNLINGSANLFSAVLFAYSVRGIPFHKVAKCVFVTSMATIIVILGATSFGIIQNHVWYREGTYRYALGFRWVTYLPHYLLNLSILWICLQGRRRKTLDHAIVLLISMLVYISSDSRNSFFLTLLLVCGSLCVGWVQENVTGTRAKASINRLLAVVSFPLFCFLSIVLPMVYNPHTPLMAWLNTVLSNRLEQTHESLLNYGITPFGRKIEFVGRALQPDGSDGLTKGMTTDYVDSSYAHILITKGLVVLMIVMIILCVLGVFAAHKGNMLLCLALFLFALDAAVDPQLLDLNYTFIWLCFASTVENQRMDVEVPQSVPANRKVTDICQTDLDD